MIKFAKPFFSDQEFSVMSDVFESGIFVHGKYTQLFEDGFKKFTGAPVSLSFANCTVALQAAHQHAMITRQIERGSEIICPAMTHVATSHAIECAGLTPIYCDCDDTGNIDVTLIENLITNKTRGISVVHFNGVPADMDSVMKIARKYDLYVVEDCAISIGAKYDNKHVGLIGDYGCFSFHPVKQMTTGEGGMLISKHSDYEEYLRLYRAFGVTKQFNERKISGHYDVSIIGSNFRMAEIPSAIGLQQLQKLDSMLEKRKINYKLLEQGLAQSKFYQNITDQAIDPKKKRSYYCYIAMLPNNLNRNEFQVRLREQGLETSVYYPSPVPHFSFKNSNLSYPKAEKIAYHSIAIPIGPHLDTSDTHSILELLNISTNLN